VNREDLQTPIAQGEGEQVEFKRGWSADVGEKLASLANTEGGVMLIGIAADDTVVGLSEAKLTEVEEKVANACNSVQPPLTPQFERVLYQGKGILSVCVAKSSDVHYARGGCWVRVGSTTRPATPDEVTRLLQDKGKLPTDSLPVRQASYTDLQEDKIKRYIEERLRTTTPRLANGRGTQETAISLGLAKREGERVYPTVAGLLFFGVYPQQFIIQSTVRAIRFRGTDVNSRMILDRAGLTGTLDEIIDASVQFVARNMKVARLIEATGRDIPEYPIAAVREAIANACIHRDYTIVGREVLIGMFDDRLEVESPGGLAGHVTLENLDRTRFARNPQLAVIAFELGKAERAGTGIPRIKHEMATLGSRPPLFHASRDTFVVVLPSRHLDLDDP